MAKHKAFDANCTKSAQRITETAKQTQPDCKSAHYQNLNSVLKGNTNGIFSAIHNN
tara:strand:- start:29 stop:196 length:168 start_codon:yes stop_codon:yes gene_type:complete